MGNPRNISHILARKIGAVTTAVQGTLSIANMFFYLYFIPMFASGPCYHPVVFRCSELCETTLHRGVKSKKQWGCQSTNEANHLASLFWSLCVSYHCSFLGVCPLLTCICLFGCIVLLLFFLQTRTRFVSCKLYCCGIPPHGSSRLQTYLFCVFWKLCV
jgi:hypothetical protein